MKRIFFFLSFICVGRLSIAQWEVIYNNENVSLLYDLLFTTPSNGYIVGGQKFILTTADAGATWAIDSSYEGLDFRDVDFIDKDTGLICCLPFDGDGNVLITYDGGLSWFTPDLDNGLPLQLMELLPGGNVVFADVTGSFAYSFIATNYYSYNIYSTIVDPAERIWTLTFLNADTGYLTGEFVSDPFSTVYKTIDGGLNWFIHENMYGPLYSITFPSDSVGYGLGYESRVWKTTDFGESWIMLPYDFGGYGLADIDLTIAGVYFYNDTIGYMLAKYSDIDKTEILRTNDGGISWYPTLVNDADFTGMSSFFCTNLDTCYAVSHGKIYKTTNGGGFDTTTAITSFQNNNFCSIYPSVTTTSIHLQIPSNVFLNQIETWSILGQKIPLYFNEHNDADVRNLANGIYFTAIYSNGKRQVIKWIKN